MKSMKKTLVFFIAIILILGQILGPTAIVVSAIIDGFEAAESYAAIGISGAVDSDDAADDNGVAAGSDVVDDDAAGEGDLPEGDDALDNDEVDDDDAIEEDDEEDDKEEEEDEEDEEIAPSYIGIIPFGAFPPGWSIEIGDPYPVDIPLFSQLMDGEIWKGKSVVYLDALGNPATLPSDADGRVLITLYIWGKSYTNSAGQSGLLLGGDQSITISAGTGDFKLDSSSYPFTVDGMGNLVWVIDESYIKDTAAPFAITYLLYLDEDPIPGWRSDFWYTTEGADIKIEFTPGTENPYYWTREETIDYAFTLTMNWNNGTGINSGTITDNILGQTFSFGSNTSPAGQTAAQAGASDWAHNAMSLGITYDWHLYWVKGELNRTYLFTIRNFGGTGRDLVYEVNVTGMGGNIVGAPGGRTITSETFFRRTYEAGTGYPFEWTDDGRLIYSVDAIARVRLIDPTTIDPPVGAMTVIKELDGYWQQDWDVTPTTLFQVILRNDAGEFAVLLPGVGANEFYFSGFTASELLATQITFSTTQQATINDLPTDFMYIMEELFFYDASTLNLIDTYNLIKTTISVNGAPFAPIDVTEIAITDGGTTNVVVENYFAHGIGYMEIFKLLDGFPDDWGIGRDDTFYVRIWDVEAENYLLFTRLDHAFGPGGIYWCVGNHEYGLSEYYPFPLAPVMEIPISANNFARLSNLWTWGAYEVREVRRVQDQTTTDAAWTNFWLGVTDRNPFSPAWDPTWIDNVWLDGATYWEYVQEIISDPAWHDDKTWNWGVIYSEGNGEEILHLGEVITVSVTNRYKFHGGTVILEKDLSGDATGWGIDGDTVFYARVLNQNGDVLVFVPDGTDFRVIGFIHQDGSYTVLCPVGAPTPPSYARTQIPFSANSPATLIEVPSYPYGYDFYYIVEEVFPNGEPDGFTGREYFIVDGGLETPMPAGGFPIPNESTTNLIISNTFVPAFVVIYNGNGNTGGTAPADSPHYEGETVVVLGRGDLSRDGYIFMGWNTQPGGGGTQYDPGDTFIMPGANVNLYAQWEPVPPDTFTVTYHGNGNTEGTDPVDTEPFRIEGDAVEVQGPGDLARDGFRFVGWHTDPDGLVGTAYAPGDTFIMPGENVRLYAQWVPAFQVIYHGNGNTGGTDPVDATLYLPGETATVLDRGDLTRDGFIFLGWHTDPDGLVGTAYAPGDTIIMPSANINLYAQWEPVPPATYTVTYHGNRHTGGTAPVDTTLYSAGDTVTVLGPGDLVREGFIFLGWNTNRYGYGTWRYPNDTFVMPARNIRLYAQWQRIPRATYQVIYHGNGHTGGIVPVDTQPSRAAGDTVAVQGPGNMVREGFTFLGWNTQPGGGGTQYAPGATFIMPNANVNLYAQWRMVPPPDWPGQPGDDSRDRPEPPPRRPQQGLLDPSPPAPQVQPTTPEPPEPTPLDRFNPPTGDDAKIGLWIALLLFSTLGLAAVIVIRIRTKT